MNWVVSLARGFLELPQTLLFMEHPTDTSGGAHCGGHSASVSAGSRFLSRGGSFTRVRRGGVSLAQGPLHAASFLFNTTLYGLHGVTSSRVTPGSGDTRLQARPFGEGGGGTCLIFSSLSLSTLLPPPPPPPIATPRPGSLQIARFAHPSWWVLSALPRSCPLWSSLPGRFQSRCIFSSWASSPPRAPRAPHLPPALLAPPPASPRRPDPSVSGRAGRLSRGRCPGGRRLAGGAGERRDRGEGERESWPGGRGEPVGAGETGEKGASGWEARTADGCSGLQRLRAAPQSLQLVTLELCPGTAETESPSSAERYQRDQEKREREGFPGNAEAEQMEEQCRLQKKTLAPKPGRSAGEPPPAACSPTALGVVPGVALILSLAGIGKLFFPTFAA